MTAIYRDGVSMNRHRLHLETTFDLDKQDQPLNT